MGQPAPGGAQTGFSDIQAAIQVAADARVACDNLREKLLAAVRETPEYKQAHSDLDSAQGVLDIAKVVKTTTRDELIDLATKVLEQKSLLAKIEQRTLDVSDEWKAANARLQEAEKYLATVHANSDAQAIASLPQTPAPTRLVAPEDDFMPPQPVADPAQPDSEMRGGGGRQTLEQTLANMIQEQRQMIEYLKQQQVAAKGDPALVPQTRQQMLHMIQSMQGSIKDFTQQAAGGKGAAGAGAAPPQEVAQAPQQKPVPIPSLPLPEDPGWGQQPRTQAPPSPHATAPTPPRPAEEAKRQYQERQQQSEEPDRQYQQQRQQQEQVDRQRQAPEENDRQRQTFEERQPQEIQRMPQLR